MKDLISKIKVGHLFTAKKESYLGDVLVLVTKIEHFTENTKKIHFVDFSYYDGEYFQEYNSAWWSVCFIKEFDLD